MVVLFYDLSTLIVIHLVIITLQLLVTNILRVVIRCLFKRSSSLYLFHFLLINWVIFVTILNVQKLLSHCYAIMAGQLILPTASACSYCWSLISCYSIMIHIMVLNLFLCFFATIQLVHNRHLRYLRLLWGLSGGSLRIVICLLLLASALFFLLLSDLRNLIDLVLNHLLIVFVHYFGQLPRASVVLWFDRYRLLASIFIQVLHIFRFHILLILKKVQALMRHVILSCLIMGKIPITLSRLRSATGLILIIICFQYWLFVHWSSFSLLLIVIVIVSVLNGSNNFIHFAYFITHCV